MRILKTSALSLLLTLGIGFGSASSADLVHFANGNNVRGKLERMTGDIIEFRRSKHFFGSMDFFKRIQLTDRHDVVETHNGQKYFGEIIYMDDLTLEIQTASGNVSLSRLALTNVVLGSPLYTPNTPPMSQVSVQPQVAAPEPPNMNNAEQPATISPTDDSE